MDHILILKYCNFVSVSLDSDTRPLMIPVCTAHPSPLMLRALGLESYLKLRTCKASSLVQLSHLDHFVFQFPLLFEFSIFTLHLDLDAEFCGQLISLGVVHIVRPSQLLLRRMQLLMQCLHLLLQCLHFCLLQCANLLHKLWVAAVEVEWWWLLVWLLLVWLLLVVGRLLVLLVVARLLVLLVVVRLLVLLVVDRVLVLLGVSRLLGVARLLVLLVVARLLVLLVVDSVLVLLVVDRLLVVARMLVVAKWCTMLLLLLASQVILLMVIARLVPLLTRLAPLFIRLVPLAIRPITLLTMVACHLAGVWLCAVPCKICS